MTTGSRTSHSQAVVTSMVYRSHSFAFVHPTLNSLRDSSPLFWMSTPSPGRNFYRWKHVGQEVHIRQRLGLVRTDNHGSKRLTDKQWRCQQRLWKRSDQMHTFYPIL